MQQSTSVAIIFVLYGLASMVSISFSSTVFMNSHSHVS
jgi:hypothetical protein